MTCALPVGWQYVLQSYRENVQGITNKVDTARSSATVAANSAREYAKDAAEYEKQTMEVVAVKRRDAMLAESVKITDFFDKAAGSWAALGRITDAANDATNAARKAEEAAKAVSGSGTDGTHAHTAHKKAVAAVKATQDAESEAEFAQARVSESQKAKDQDAEARKQASDNAKKAAEAAESLKDRMEKSSAALLKAVKGAEEVRGLAEQAIAVAVEGDKNAALSLAEKASKAAGQVGTEMEELRKLKEGAHKTFFDLVKYHKQDSQSASKSAPR